MSYGILGPRGTFSEEAAILYWGGGVQLQEAGNIPQLFGMVEKGEVEGALVPIDNSRAGSIEPTMEGLSRNDVLIAGEISIPVRQHLLSCQRYALDEIELLISQPAALVQCEEFIQEHLPRVRTEIVASTTRAAQLLASENRKAVAIAHAQAARLYGLEILCPDISGKDNITRFIHISAPGQVARGKKSSLIFTLPDQPGALYRALAVLAERGINMSKIESRPSRYQKGRYWFYIEVATSGQEGEIKELLGELCLYCSNLKYLGSYPAGHNLTGIQ